MNIDHFHANFGVVATTFTLVGARMRAPICPKWIPVELREIPEYEASGWEIELLYAVPHNKELYDAHRA